MGRDKRGGGELMELSLAKGEEEGRRQGKKREARSPPRV